MCGIIAAVSHEQNVIPSLMQGLKRLEYRGYDSSGVATLCDGIIERRRKVGKIHNLETHLGDAPLSGQIGIAHTRWATHGKPSDVNAHPHATSKVAVVHNGIIENYEEIKKELIQAGHVFESETDTEVVAHLVSHYLDIGLDALSSIQKAAARFRGAYALAFIFSDKPDTLYGARKGSPLVVGYGDGVMYIGSDSLALSPFTQTIAYLDEGDVTELTPQKITIFDASGAQVVREVRVSSLSDTGFGKDNYPHFMLKEINQQPDVVEATLLRYINKGTLETTFPQMPFQLSTVERLSIVACGTSYYAAMVAKYWFESIAQVSVDVDIASEFRYRAPVMPKGGLALFVSQSGETADTLAALRHAAKCNQHILSIVNQIESSIARESHVILPLMAGPEIGVASSKAFTCQLAVLSCFAIAIAVAKGVLDKSGAKKLLSELLSTPVLMRQTLASQDTIQSVASLLAPVHTVLYLGRGTSFPLALEGALKLKELSYIHAEGYAAGEMKHGPIALIDSSVPIVVLCPQDALFDKTHSNVEEVMARGGRIIVLSDREGLKRFSHETQKIELPLSDPFVAPFIYSIPLQLMAYHTALLKGHDVDQPRNLAKSVTVE